MKPALAALVLVLGGGSFTDGWAPRSLAERGREPARAVTPLGRFVRGLGRGEDHADAGAGVVALRPPPSGRVRIPGGAFTMGSTPIGMAKAVGLCRR